VLDTFRVLKQPNVLKLFLSFIITYTGTAMAPIAMAFGVLDITGSAKDTSIVMAAATLATVIVVLIGGAVADRTSRKKVMQISEFSSAVLQAMIAALFSLHQVTVPLLAVLMFMNGVALAFNAPAAAGLIPSLVESKDLQTVNALLGMAKNSAMIVGAALAGILVSFYGAGMTVLIDAITFLLSAFLITSLHPSQQNRLSSHSIIQELKEGWHEFISHTWLWTIVLQFGFVLAAYQSILVLVGPAVANDYYDGAKAWGWIMSAVSIGLLLGGIIGMRLKPRYPLRFATFCVFTGALIPFGIGLLLPLPIILFLAVINGCGWEVFIILWVSLLQKKITPEALSRVTAYDYLGSIGLAPLGIIVAGYCYERFGYLVVSMTAALMIVVATVLVLFVNDVWNNPAEKT
jgi:predicted MFS family arabinose efflux permease